MSSLRPGTVDYSHFDNISVSSSSSDDDDNDGYNYAYDEAPPPDEMNCDNDEEEDEEDEDDEDEDDSSSEQEEEEEEETRPSERRTADLVTLQKAWGNSSNNDSKEQQQGRGLVRTCAACSKPSPRYKCSRCRVTWYCNVACQRAYHHIHRSECFDASKHFAYWGYLNNDSDSDKKRKNSNSNDSSTKEDAVMRALFARRRRALKLAAAAAAVERARLAREAAGNTHNKGKGGGKDAQDKEETCAICQCEFTVLGETGGSLVCPGSHFMCGECTGVFVKSVVSDLETSYPPKCSMCRVEYPSDHFERQLTTKQQLHLKTYVARQALQPGQELIKCTGCDHFEIITTRTDDPVVVWWCDACGKGTCLVCNKDLPPRGSSNVENDNESTTDVDHSLCAKLRHAKKMVENAIESGSKMSCPGCGLAGRKDDACTHMTCPKCSTVWCYVCGLDVKQCNKAPKRTRALLHHQDEDEPDDIFLHNRDWEINDARCPMYLTQILEVDMGWLGENWEDEATNEDFEDDEKCLDYFHRFQTVRKLQEVKETIGLETLSEVFEHFGSVRNSGYTLEEVISTCTEKLIDRDEYLQYRHMEDEDEDADGEQVLEHQEGVVAHRQQQQRLGDAWWDEDSAEMEADEDGEEEEEGWEDVPEEMTRAVLMEEDQMRQAIERSQASMEEDEQFRQVITDSKDYNEIADL